MVPRLVTIAIPVFNVEKYIERSLKSALNQTINDIEILIIDDGSTDNSLRIIHKIKNEKKTNITIRIIQNEGNKGIGYSRNRALIEANSQYLFFLDADDILETNAIEVLYQAISEEKTIISIGSTQTLSEDGVSIQNNQLPHYVSHQVEEYGFLRYGSMRKILTSYIYNVLFDLDFLKSTHISISEIRSYEDVLFWFQFIPYVHSFVLIPNITYKYIIRSSSLSDYLNSGIIKADKILNQIKVQTYETENLIRFQDFDYFKDICISIMHTNLHCVLSILRNIKRIEPTISIKLLKPLLSLNIPFTCIISASRNRNELLLLYFFGKLPLLVQIKGLQFFNYMKNIINSL